MSLCIPPVGTPDGPPERPTTGSLAGPPRTCYPAPGSSKPLNDDPARGAFSGYLYAWQPHGLASAGFGGVGPGSASGIGLVFTSSAAVLRPRDMYVAGTGEAEESLRALITEWTRAGQPDHTALQPILTHGSEGFSVEVKAYPLSRSPVRP
jgi:hypothetical protein